MGDCNTPGTLEQSTNGGKSWQPLVKAGLAPIVQLGIEKGGLYTIGGTGKNCSALYVAYSSNGVVTGRTDYPAGVWFPNPHNRDQVQGPGRAKAFVCGKQPVVGLAAHDISKAVVICSKGSMMATFNSGKSWKRVDYAPGTLAVAAGEGRYWTVRSTKNCNGVSVQSFAIRRNGLTPGSSLCAAVPEVTTGDVAIGVDGDLIWLWANKTVMVSPNNGRSWS